MRQVVVLEVADILNEVDQESIAEFVLLRIRARQIQIRRWLIYSLKVRRV